MSEAKPSRRNEMDRDNFSRTAGFWCAVGAVIGTAGGIVTGLVPPSVPTTAMSYPYSPTVYSFTQIVWASCQLLMFLGTLGLARSGSAGSSRLGRVGLWIALVGMAAIVPGVAAFAFIASDPTDSTAATTLSTLVGVASNLAGLGFVLVGIAVLRARRWQGRHRFIPLLCGLYVFVALTPVLAAFPGLFFWGLAGWNACFILLGLALTQQRLAPGYAVRSAAPA
jgi:hypothetical protein